MKLFTEVITESRKEYNQVTLQQVKDFYSKVKSSKAVSKEYLRILSDTIELGLTDGQILDDRIINGGSSDFKWAASNLGGTLEMYVEINRLAKKCKPELRGLPQLMTGAEFNDVISGKRDIGDITLDLETEKGR